MKFKKKIVTIKPIEIIIGNAEDLESVVVTNDNTITYIIYLDFDNYLKNYINDIDDVLDDALWEIIRNEKYGMGYGNLEINKNYEIKCEVIYLIDKNDVKDNYTVDEIQKYKTHKIIIYDAFLIVSDGEIEKIY